MLRNKGNKNRFRSRIAAVAGLGLAASLSLPAWAGRPLATEDAGVLGRGECEIESFAGRARASGGDTEHTRWAQFGCGIGYNSQLALGAGDQKAGGETTHISAVVGKTYLRELTDDQTGVVIAYAFLGAKAPGEGFKHEATEIKAVLTGPTNGWLLHANLGSNFSHTAAPYGTVWALAAERPAAVGPVDLMAEVFGDNHSDPWVQFGARWQVVPERFFLDASWGVQTDSARTKVVTIGLKLAF
jgi:hypothetical protein